MKHFSRQPLSLTIRVMVFVGIAIGLSMLVNGILVLNAVERHFAEQDAGELAVMTQAIEKSLREADNEPARLLEFLSRAVSGHHDVYYQVQNPGGAILYSTPGADFTQPTKALVPVTRINPAQLYTWQSNGKTLRGVITQATVNGRNYLIGTAIDFEFHSQFLLIFRRSLWLIMSLAGIATVVAAWFGVHQGHTPLRELSEKMSRIQADQLNVRLERDGVPGELQGLVDSFNAMAGRLEDSFNRLSNFSADIAHELRTPLTSLITQTQVGLGKARSPDEYRELLYSNLEEQERLAKMVNDMLWLAKSDHGLLKPVHEPLDLAGEINELFDFFGALAEDKQIQLRLTGTAPTIHGDRAMLRRALSNLLSNAIRHTPSGKEIEVRLETHSSNEVLISIGNPGLEIPAEHLPLIFNRFYMANPSRQRQSEGTGLGLAITRSIVEAHGGRIEATSTASVTTFTLWLPA